MSDRLGNEGVQRTFNTIATGYDNDVVRFFAASAQYIAKLLNLEPNAHVLDVACGTGNASLAVAAGQPGGRVTGVDFSPRMLEQAKAKAQSLGLRNVEFLCRDMEDMGFSPDLFDAATCAFGIHFAKDIGVQLGRVVSTIKPGGRLVVSSFRDGSFDPLNDVFLRDAMAYGATKPVGRWQQIATEAACCQLFERTGLVGVDVTSKDLGYFLKSEQQWWELIWNTGFRALVEQIDSADRERFKQSHLENVRALRTTEGIRLNVHVLFVVATKAGS